MLGVLEKSKSYARLHCLKCLASRYLSTKQEVVDNPKEEITKNQNGGIVTNERERSNDIISSRRFLSPAIIPKPKPYIENFVYNLLSGVFDKQIFDYPEGIGEKQVETAICHGAEIEKILSDSSESKLSENILKRLQNVEAFGVSVPKEYGGPGYTKREAMLLYESFGVNPKLGRILTYNDIATRVLFKYGTEEQKQKYLPKIASGDCVVTLAYLEDCPAIDLASFQGYAIKDEVNKGFIINGKKKWVHNADIADLVLVLTRSTLYVDEQPTQSSDMFIVEKNAPGVKVSELNSKASEEYGLYEVGFNDVFVPANNLVGTVHNYGSLMIQSILAYTGLSHSVLCSSLMKKLLYSATHYCEKKKQGSKPLLNYQYIRTCISHISVYSFALESMVYMNAGRLDMYEGPHLFLESMLSQMLAVDLLQLCIDKYMKITGAESLFSSGVLDEALKDLHYYSTFDENVLHLKLMIGGGGFVYSNTALNKRLKVLKAKHDHPWQAFKWSFSTLKKRLKEKKEKHDIKMDLHISLQREGDLLETMLTKLESAVEEHWIRFNREAVEEETILTKFAEMAAYIYGVTACLARSSSSVCNDINNYDYDLKMCAIFTDIAHAKINQLFTEVTRGVDTSSYESEIGDVSFKNKLYPSEHPLARSY